ncbi:MAG TPA: DUF4175 family protein [Acetobacteraceae bacterium]|nr:DUF4175 family protein [Acetobacteraceae bacterium]
MSPAADATARLERQRLAARLALAFERLWPLLWPPLGLLGLFVAAALFGLVSLLPPWPHLLLLVLLAAGTAALAGRSLARFSFPTRPAADRWLELTNHLVHRPLAAIADRPAVTGATASLLWQAHRARMAAHLARIRVGLPHPNLAARDPRALRMGLIVGLVAGIGVGGPDSLDRLAAAFTPVVPMGAAPTVPELAGWITPPAYTHLPPLFLRVPGGPLAVPAGSRLAVSLTGGSGAPRLAFAGHSVPFDKLGPSSYRAATLLAESGRLSLTRRGAVLGAWDLSVIAATPPTVRFTGLPGPDQRSTDTRFPWHAHDTYGVTRLSAVLHLAARPGAPALTVPIPLTGGDPRDEGGAALADLTASPWAGLEVTARLHALNGAGLAGASGTVRFHLPEIAFRNPLARALIAVRKELVLQPDAREPAIAALDALSATPAARNGDLGAFLNMRAIAALLARDLAPAAVGRAEDRLWQLAWHYEEGPTAETARALAAATRALEQALAEAGRPGGPQQKEIDRRIAALEQAIDRQIEALARNLTPNSLKLPDQLAARQYDEQTFQRMAEAMRQAIARGDLGTARQEMAELQNLLRQLQNARPLTAEDMARAMQMQKGQQALSALGDVVQREGGLLDRAEARLTSPDAAPASPGSAQSPGQGAAAGRRADQTVQQALRQVLGVMMSSFSDAMGKIPPALGKADIAMRGAAGALGAGEDQPAAAAERKAIAYLQQGGRQAMSAMAAQAGTAGMQPGAGGAGFLMEGGPFGANPGQGEMGRAPGIGLDPLGRPTGDQIDGGNPNGFVNIPNGDVAAEARAIQQELRSREANPDLPVPDRDYIDRLLKQF